jgi:hypothetical protein
VSVSARAVPENAAARIAVRRNLGMSAFEEFKAYWAVAEELIAKATKEQVAEVARILALQSAAYAQKFADLPLDDHLGYLKATDTELARAIVGDDGGKTVGVLRDGAVALVGVLAVVAEVIGRERDLL